MNSRLIVGAALRGRPFFRYLNLLRLPYPNEGVATECHPYNFVEATLKLLLDLNKQSSTNCLWSKTAYPRRRHPSL